MNTKYGLKKIYKVDYNLNPERYELRIDFSDAPLCPYGNSFRAIGYDKIENEYIWLVTSILKDKRLKTINYKHDKK
ncbi:MAG: hypothetical protein R2831_09410 [Chitinophagaceae bacterium]